MHVDLISEIEAFESLHTVWDTALHNSPANSVFLTHTWLSIWLRHYGSSGNLRIFVVRDGTQIVGIAPLIVRNREGFRRLATIGQETLDYENLIIASNANRQEVSACLVDAILADPSWDLLQFNRISAATDTLSVAQACVGQAAS